MTAVYAPTPGYCKWRLLIFSQCAEKLGKPEFAKAAIYASLAQTHKDLGQYPEAKRWFERELGARQDKPTEVSAERRRHQNHSSPQHGYFQPAYL